ncbi:MAG: hypothetical protein A3C84_00590 [Candidatus Ryanbacteria bacterium RIFCSPHIGHO2_02_FULL_48_12]|uniref:CopC domain-containing protein n=1 Tax=Candidatus Ryanbacteria bacterium RIFCSPHIGHO2_01_FULL_48_27 TaxID=1802115 RepID=A0A1G2G7A5_9BACT|nr:MAG: hypothetical protein A2756_02510 [Candidatus Ryanbacteria bacterium RIFCSPHIGHO2_01_FULL_48_27]OGZ49283.1 MAG: hypothetical protein A3C84_00590 [Candidatus Ryanbacteria bacterium RIFCSPHIGHO2_02_FULL_48_12]
MGILKNIYGVCFALAALGGFFVPWQLVYAHATPISYDPGAASILDEIPKEVIIHFSERIEPKASSIKIFGPNGADGGAGPAVLSSSDNRVLRAPVRDAGKGSYTASWQVVSADDGHFTKGAFTFSVGYESQSDLVVGTEVAYSSFWSDALLIWIELFGQALLFAGLVFLGLIRHSKQLAPFGDLVPSYRRLRWVFIAGALLVVVGTCFYVLKQAYALRELQHIDWLAALTAFSSTVSGTYALWRGVLGGIFLLIFLGRWRAVVAASKATYIEYALFIVVLGMALLRARVSHAAASHLWPEFSILVNGIHLLAKNFWVGGALISSLLFFDGRIGSRWLALVAKCSQYISIAFGIAAVSGAYIIWLHLKGLANVLTTDWGYQFLVLSTLAVLLLCVRLYNQFVGWRAAARLSSAGAVDEPRASDAVHARMRIGYGIEALVGVMMLFATSFIIITTPPLMSGPLFEKHISSQGVAMVFRDSLEQPDQFLLTLSSESHDPDFMVHKITLTLTNEAAGIGPIVALLPPVDRATWEYTLAKADFNPPGVWKVALDAEQHQGYDAVGYFTLDFPKEVADRYRAVTERQLGFFEWMMIFGALAGAIFSLLLYRANVSLERRLNDTR